jgi:hypothetical protein
MTLKKILISLALVAMMAMTFVSCGGTKSICPAYSSVETKTVSAPNS